MPIYNGPGGVNMAAIYHGSTPIARVYNGADLVWDKAGGGSDPHWSNVMVLVGADGTDGAAAVNEAGSGITLARLGTPQNDTAQAMFGAGSWLFDGSDVVTVTTASAMGFPGQFTVESFVRFNAISPTIASTIFFKGGSTFSYDWALYYFPGNGLRFRMNTGSSSIDAPWSPSTGVWYHVAADRDASNVLRVYINGVMGNKATVSGTLGTSSTAGIGAANNPAWYLNGHLDEVRITKGVARYASDAGFTVPTAAFPRS